MKKFLFNNSKDPYSDKQDTVIITARKMQKMLLNIGSTIDYRLIPKKSVYRFNY